MIITFDYNEVFNKMSQLCGELLEQESYQKLRAMIDQFLNNEGAMEQYNEFLLMQEQLEHKENEQIPLTSEEIEAYERAEIAIYGNNVIRQYIYAVKEFEKIRHFANSFFTKTIELNRLPQMKELKKNGCGCGGACGGGH